MIKLGKENDEAYLCSEMMEEEPEKEVLPRHGSHAGSSESLLVE